MPIRVEYTPVGATGSMAAAAGRASAATREQQYAFQRQQQQEQIRANQQAQRRQQEVQRQQLMTQAAGQAGRVTAGFQQAAAAGEQAMAQQNIARANREAQDAWKQQEFQIQQEQYERDAEAKREAFRMKDIAVERSNREFERQQADREARTQMLQLEGVQRVEEKETKAQNMELAIQNLMDNRESMSDADYARSLTALYSGKSLPSITKTRTTGQLTELQRLKLAAEKVAPMKSTDVTRAQIAARRSIGPEKATPFSYTKNQGAMLRSYKGFKSAFGYNAINTVQKNQLDTIWDNAVEDANVTGLFDRHEFQWDPNDPSVISTRAAKGKITEDKIAEYKEAAGGDIARATQMARADGWNVD